MNDKQKIKLGEYIIDFFKGNLSIIKHTNLGREIEIADSILNKIQKLESQGNTTEIEMREEFVWGPVVEVYEVGEHQIVEYHPMIFEGCHGTGKYEKEKTKFHVWGRNNSYQSLDTALIGAISFKHDGINTRAPQYIALMLGIE